MAEKRFPMPPPGIDIDYIYDPYIRAVVLVDAIERHLKSSTLLGRTQEEQEVKTYFVAHPILAT